MAKAKPAPLPDDVVNNALREAAGEVRLTFQVKPKSAKEGLEPGPEGTLVVRVSAPPVDGKANARVVEVLATRLGLKKSDVVLVRGETARHKEVALHGLTLNEARARLLEGDAG